MGFGTCKKCDKGIIRQANLTEYKGAKYHSSCFNCDGCGTNITGPAGFINHQDKLFCHPCYEKDIAEKCDKCQQERCSLDTCNQPITPGSQYVEIESNKFHKNCFRCSNCSKVISDQPFVKDDDGNFCADCADS